MNDLITKQKIVLLKQNNKIQGIPSIQETRMFMQQNFAPETDPATRNIQKLKINEFNLKNICWPRIWIMQEDNDLGKASLHSFMNMSSSLQSNKIGNFYRHGRSFTEIYGLASTKNITDIAKSNGFESDIFAKVSEPIGTDGFIIQAPHLDFDWECIPIDSYPQRLPDNCYKSFQFTIEHGLPLTDFRIALPKARPRVYRKELRDPYFIACFDSGFFTRFKMPFKFWVYLDWWL